MLSSCLSVYRCGVFGRALLCATLSLLYPGITHDDVEHDESSLKWTALDAPIWRPPSFRLQVLSSRGYYINPLLSYWLNYKLRLHTPIYRTQAQSKSHKNGGVVLAGMEPMPMLPITSQATLRSCKEFKVSKGGE